MIKTIIFDNIGVFTKTNGLAKAFDTVSQKFGFDRELVGPAYRELANRANVGEITATEMFQQLIDKFGVNATPQQLKDIWTDCYGECPDPEMYEYAKRLSGEYRICLFTNYSDIFDDLHQKLNLEEVFSPDMIFVSSRIGHKKPAAESFQHVLDKLRALPHETAFVDDREDNCEQAQAMGVKGIVFKDREQLERDFEALVMKEAIGYK